MAFVLYYIMKEVWRDIKNYEGYYQVSNLGNVKGLKRTIQTKQGIRFIKEKTLSLKNIDGNGYRTVGLCKDAIRITFPVHRLVANSFLKKNGEVVDHINNIKTDNRVVNLQFTTNRINCSKDKKGGTSKYVGVGWNKHANKWKSRIQIDGVDIHLGYFTNEYQAYLAYKKALKEML